MKARKNTPYVTQYNTRALYTPPTRYTHCYSVGILLSTSGQREYCNPTVFYSCLQASLTAVNIFGWSRHSQEGHAPNVTPSIVGWLFTCYTLPLAECNRFCWVGQPWLWYVEKVGAFLPQYHDPLAPDTRRTVAFGKGAEEAERMRLLLLMMLMRRMMMGRLEDARLL